MIKRIAITALLFRLPISPAELYSITREDSDTDDCITLQALKVPSSLSYNPQTHPPHKPAAASALLSRRVIKEESILVRLLDKSLPKTAFRIVPHELIRVPRPPKTIRLVHGIGDVEADLTGGRGFLDASRTLLARMIGEEAHPSGGAPFNEDTVIVEGPGVEIGGVLALRVVLVVLDLHLAFDTVEGALASC